MCLANVRAMVPLDGGGILVLSGLAHMTTDMHNRNRLRGLSVLRVGGKLPIPLTLAQVIVSTVTGLRISITGHPRTPMAVGLSIVTATFFALVTGIKLGPVFIAVLTFLIGAGLGSTMPSAQTMVQWAAGEARLGVGTALVSFGRSIGGVLGAALASAVLLGALQVVDPHARDTLSHELAAIGSSHVEASQVAPALISAYRWVFLALGGLSACAATMAWSIPNLDMFLARDGIDHCCRPSSNASSNGHFGIPTLGETRTSAWFA